MSAPTKNAEHTATRRLAGPDVVRAVALIGVVVMNYHGYLLLADDRGPGRTGDGWVARLFDPWVGPLSTRFAATFVLVAGVGVSLMTQRSVETRRTAPTPEALLAANAAVMTLRWRLVRRGLLLYVAGLLLEEIWPGTIIPFYGAMFVLAAAMFTWRSRWLILVGAGAATAGWAIRLWQYERDLDAQSTTWLTSPAVGSIRDHLFGVFVNGTHPLLPWLAFFSAGMVLGRVLRTSWWRPAAFAVGSFLVGVAALATIAASTPRLDVALSIVPFDRGIAYVASALGTALIAYAAIDWIATHHPVPTDPLRCAGQMTLSLYLLHVLVFNLLVDWLGWVEPAGLDVALTFAVVFWIVGLVGAVAWQRRFGVGPAERVYRAVGG